jgi:hypothetical protein
MTRIITMSATPSSQGTGSLPTSLSFNPPGQITEHTGTSNIFKVEASLLTYINDSSLAVTLIWNGNSCLLINGDDVSREIGDSKVNYSLTVAPLSDDLGGENSTTTSGDIIVT